MFHACLAELTESSYLIGALEEIRDLTNLAGLRSLEVGSRAGEAIEEHERIVAEPKGRSLRGALGEMEAHIRTTEGGYWPGYEPRKSTLSPGNRVTRKKQFLFNMLRLLQEA